MQRHIQQKGEERFAMAISCKLHHIHATRWTSLPLTFSSFFFGRLNARLQECKQFRAANEVLSGVRKILDEISANTLEAVFRERLDKQIGPMHCSIARNEKYLG
jgi:hypothetical protein